MGVDLLVVRGVFIDLDTAVELFKEEKANHLVCKGHF